MKKFISMVMAAAMVVSLVPATAFAATGEIKADGTVKVVDAREEKEGFKDLHGNGAFAEVEGYIKAAKAPQVQIKIDSVDVANDATWSQDITVELDGADFADGVARKLEDREKADGNDTGVKTVLDGLFTVDGATKGTDYDLTVKDWDNTSVTYNIKKGTGAGFNTGDVIKIDLQTVVGADAGDVAKVSVDTDIVGGSKDDMVFCTVKEEGIKATLKKVAEVAEEETTKLEKDLKIEAQVDKFAANQMLKLRLPSGFEFTNIDPSKVVGAVSATGADVFKDADDDNVLWVRTANVDEVTLKVGAFEVDAVKAKVGEVATIKITTKKDNAVANSFEGSAEVEAVKVVGNTVTLSVEEDEDLPVIYSGVNVANDGINDNSDHKSLKVTLKESVKEALDTKKAFTMTLPEGVFVTDVKVTDIDYKVNGGTINGTKMQEMFATAYDKGEQECFEFARKTWTDSTEPFEVEFEMTLIAVPGFEGDVTLTLAGDAFDGEAEVTIAKFVSPWTVEAAQNDLIIDYRNTKVPTNIVVKEAEAGLWDDSTTKALKFDFAIDRFNDDAFEDDAVYTVNAESDMEVKAAKNGVGFTVDEESDDEAAVVTISDISLYMGRSIAAGAYDLQLFTNAGYWMMTSNRLFTTEDGNTDHTAAAVTGTLAATTPYYAADFADWDVEVKAGTNNDVFVGEYDTVKEGFINVITAGRDQDDASFTKKVVVPVGENYIVAGEETVALDVPAYISAAGYTMLPVRAVAVALGINNNNVLWDQATKTVTILYGQRIITMVAGQKVVYVNGSAIPASASVEIKDGRTFLPMRDLATALGVTDITWDAATKTATLNGSK